MGGIDELSIIHMIKYMFFTLLLCLLYLSSCSTHAAFIEAKVPNQDLYEVKKIKKVNSWYLIYLQRNDSVFKVVSKEPLDKKSLTGYQKIRKHGQYDLILHSYIDTSPVINGYSIIPQGYTGAYQLDSLTTVSLEPQNNIYDIYYSHDLDGLYYLK